MARPYVFFGSAMFISLLVFSYLGIRVAAAVLFIAVILCLISLFLFKKHRIFKILLCISCAVIFSATSFSAKTVFSYYPAVSLSDEQSHTIQGTVCGYYSQFGNFCYILDDISVDDKEVPHKIRITTDTYRNIDIDDTVILENASVHQLGSTDYSSLFYKADGIYIGTYTQSQWRITEATERSAEFYIQEMRNTINERLHRNMYEQYAAVTNALLTGEQSQISNDIIRNFRFSGVAHLFAVSGFHLALWSEYLQKALSEILKKHRILTYIILLSFVIFFMALTGFSKSVIRAGIMQIFLFTGKVIKYKSDSLNSLFIALTFILLLNPFAVTSLSLQLSFSATLGIILLSEPVSQPLLKIKEKIKPKFLYKAIEFCYTTVAISIVASIFTMPVSAISFGYFSAFTPISNLLCIWAAQIIMPLSGFAVMLSEVEFLAKPIFVICNFLTKYLISVTAKIASNPLLITETDNIFTLLPLLLIFAVTAICLIIFRNSNKNLRRCIALNTAAVLVFCVYSSGLKSESFEITVADVGNGTSVIAYVNGKSAVIGCGGGVTSDYKLTSQLDKEITGNFDLLLIPREEHTESRYASHILKNYHFGKCVIAEDNFNEEILDALPFDTQISSSCTLSLDENISLIYINNSSFSGAMIMSSDFRCVIIFNPTSDFSTVSDSWRSGDLLISRRNLPQTDIANFDTVIISTSSDAVYQNKNIHTTEHEKSLTYTKFPWGGVTLNAA